MQILIFLLLRITISTVIGIDFGTDFFKVSVIKPGGNIQTVLNRESKRKTPAIITIRDNIRTYGYEAQMLGMRFPDLSFGNLKTLVGKLFDDQEVKVYKKTFGTNIVKSDRNTVAFMVGEEKYELEELLAMLFRQAKKQAEEYSDINVTGAVITVPQNFNVFERQSILDSCELASLKVYSLIHDETAVAINYAVGKKFEKKENHMIYDMGAGTTIASIISFHSGTDAKNGIRNLVDIEVKGFDVDSNLGGHHFDLVAQKLIVDGFKTQYPASKGLENDERAMARILKESNRVKSILSANQLVFASIENLFDGKDFKLKITREEFVNGAQNLLKRVTDPIQGAISKAGLKSDDIKSLVIFGGGVRIPAIQTKLAQVIGEEKIARNVDGDEAAVFGAVLHAAKISSIFKLGQTMRIKDLNPHSIQVSYQLKSRVANTVLFTNKTNLGSRKVMTFSYENDFELDVSYVDGNKIMKVEVGGVQEALAQYNSTTEPHKIQVTLAVDESGMVHITDATAIITVAAQDPETPETPAAESLKDKVMNMFGTGKAGSTEGADSDEKIEATSEDSSSKDGDNKKKTKTDNKKVNPINEPDTTKSLIKKVKLTVKITPQHIVPLSIEQKQKIQQRMDSMDAEDQKKADREALLNGVEAYIYKVKELLWTDDIETFATETDLSSLKELLEKSSEFFEDQGDKARDSVLTKLKADLMAKADPISARIMEADRRPVFLAELQELIGKLETNFANLSQIITNTTLNEARFVAAHTLFNTTSLWLKEKVGKQALLKPHQDPVLTVADLKDKLEALKPFLQLYNPETVKMKKPKPMLEEMEETLKKSGMSEEDIKKFMAKMKDIPTSNSTESTNSTTEQSASKPDEEKPSQSTDIPVVNEGDERDPGEL